MNPSPNTFPKSCIHTGHSSPSSKDRIVPVTTPTANSREHDPRPPPRERPEEFVARPQVPPLGEQHEHGKRDPEADERDVHGQRQRLHLPRFEQIVLVHVHREPPYTHYYNT